MSDTAVTVVGGYLGAGKTTLVNHVLSAADERIVVLVNDFGEVNIDESLIVSRDGDTMTLANGCVCCSLVDGLAGVLDTVRLLEPPPDRLLIEASGVADPASIAAYAYLPGLRLDAVIVVIDAETVRTKALDRYVGDTVLGQLRSADLVLMNKVDLVSGVDAGELTQWLAETAPQAAVVRCRHAEVPLDIVFGVTPSPPVTARDLHHHDLFESWTYRTERPLVRAALEHLLTDLPEGVHRLKGIVRFDNAPNRRTVVQAVGHRWTITDDGSWDGDRVSVLVAIGRRAAVGATWLADQLEDRTP